MAGQVSPWIGLVLTRIVVPAWVLVGALFKLFEATPALLPRNTILRFADLIGIDLYLLLAILIGIELAAVAIMVCASRLARPTAVFVLSVFALVLLGEMAQGNLASCGCLGAHSPPPWVMMLIDASLLFGVIIFNPSPILSAHPPRWPLGVAAVLAVAGIASSFVVTMGARPEGGTVPDDGSPTTQADGDGGQQTLDPTINPSPTPAPSWWFTKDIDSWTGKPWRELELFGFMGRWPSGMDEGVRYVIFYSRTCDHCEDMFYEDLSDPLIGRQTTAILVPGKDARVPASAWEMPPTECEMLELPFGPDWIVTTPLAMRIEDGIVVEVNEGEHRPVLGLE